MVNYKLVIHKAPDLNDKLGAGLNVIHKVREVHSLVVEEDIQEEEPTHEEELNTLEVASNILEVEVNNQVVELNLVIKLNTLKVEHDVQLEEFNYPLEVNSSFVVQLCSLVSFEGEDVRFGCLHQLEAFGNVCYFPFLKR